MPIASHTDRDDSKFVVFARAPTWTVLCSVYAIGASYVASPPSALLIVGFLIVGVFGAGLVLLSLRYYAYWFSWLLWAVPIPAALAALVAPAVQSGAMAPLQAIFAGPGFGGMALFGLLWLFRGWWVKWVR